jgi:AcrR family transcriptional regulator
MKQINKIISDTPGLNIKQKRSKKTYDAMIKAGFKLLKKRPWDSITIAELSRTAGYSVGAFYARFKSKDEFFNALIENQSQTRKATYDRLFSKFQNDDLIDELIKDLVQYFRNKCNYWRAAQVRSMRNPEFWETIRKDGHNLAGRFIEELSKQINRHLTDSEEINVRFGLQVVFGTINSAIINQPGPIFMNQKLFVEKLTQAFRLISNYDNLKSKKI